MHSTASPAASSQVSGSGSPLTLPPVGPARPWPLVGRRDELEAFASALADPECQALCIYGRAGVGRTRLADECRASARSAGRRTFETTEGGAPLTAIAHLLPVGAMSEWSAGDTVGSTSRARLLERAVRALTAEGGDSGRAVIVVDNADRLDPSSLTALAHLVERRALFCVATLDTDRAIPDTFTRWWRDEHAVRVDLRALDRLSFDTLLHVALQGPIDGEAGAELWEISGGNPRTLERVLHGALADGTLQRPNGVWTSRPASPRGTTADRQAGVVDTPPGRSRRARDAGGLPAGRSP